MSLRQRLARGGGERAAADLRVSLAALRVSSTGAPDAPDAPTRSYAYSTCTFDAWVGPYSRLRVAVGGALDVWVESGEPRSETGKSVDTNLLRASLDAYVGAMEHFDATSTSLDHGHVAAKDALTVYVGLPTREQLERRFWALAAVAELREGGELSPLVTWTRQPWDAKEATAVLGKRHDVPEWSEKELAAVWPFVAQRLTDTLVSDLERLVRSLVSKVGGLVDAADDAYLRWADARSAIEWSETPNCTRLQCTYVGHHALSRFLSAIHDCNAVAAAMKMVGESKRPQTPSPVREYAKPLESAAERATGHADVDYRDSFYANKPCSQWDGRKRFAEMLSRVRFGSVRAAVTGAARGVRARGRRWSTLTNVGAVFNAFHVLYPTLIWSFYDLAIAVSKSLGGEELSETSSFEECLVALQYACKQVESYDDDIATCGTFNCTTTITRDGKEYLLRVSKQIHDSRYRSFKEVVDETSVAFGLGANDVAPRLHCCVAMKREDKSPEPFPPPFPTEHWDVYMVFEKFQDNVR